MFSPDKYHESVLSSKKILSFDKNKPFEEQKKQLKKNWQKFSAIPPKEYRLIQELKKP